MLHIIDSSKRYKRIPVGLKLGYLPSQKLLLTFTTSDDVTLPEINIAEVTGRKIACIVYMYACISFTDDPQVAGRLITAQSP